MILALVVLVVVLMLTAKAWKKVAPTAIDIHDAQAGSIDDHGQAEVAVELRSGKLPRLRETQERTDAHSDELQQALDASE